MHQKDYRLKETTALSRILLDEKQPPPKEHQVLRVGEFNHPEYGNFKITSEVLTEMVKNFNDRARGIDIAWDYFHDFNGVASAWVESLELRENDTELWARVTWTPLAQQKLADRELRYFSPDFAFQWQDPESGRVYNNILFGGGLTNRPFVKEMQAIVASEKKQGVKNMKTEKELNEEIVTLKAQNLKLSEQYGDSQKSLAVMSPELEAAKKEIEGLKSQIAQMMKDKEAMMGEQKKLEEAKQLAEKTSEFNKLLSEGKACVAQKEAYLKGDMDGFIKLAEKVNLKATGASGGAGGGDDDEDTKTIKLAEKLQSEDKTLSRGEAMKEARRQVKATK